MIDLMNIISDLFFQFKDLNAFITCIACEVPDP